MSSSNDNNPWASETSHGQGSTDDSKPSSSKSTNGERSRNDSNALPANVPDADGSRHTADATSNRGLIPIHLEDQDGKLDVVYMVDEDRAYNNLFFGNGTTQNGEKAAAEEDTKKDGTTETEDEKHNREIQERADLEREQSSRQLEG